jgi:hypothetical protein
MGNNTFYYRKYNYKKLAKTMLYHPPKSYLEFCTYCKEHYGPECPRLCVPELLPCWLSWGRTAPEIKEEYRIEVLLKYG